MTSSHCIWRADFKTTLYLLCYLNEQITSQNPYAEVFVGEPFVQTVDIRNIAEVEEALQKILNSSVSVDN